MTRHTKSANRIAVDTATMPPRLRCRIATAITALRRELSTMLMLFHRVLWRLGFYPAPTDCERRHSWLCPLSVVSSAHGAKGAGSYGPWRSQTSQTAVRVFGVVVYRSYAESREGR